jgi:hypothetical protein
MAQKYIKKIAFYYVFDLLILYLLFINTNQNKSNMKTKLFFLVVSILIPGSLLFAQYGGGSGTEGSPYQIASTTHLSTLAATSADWDKHFIQTAAIDFNSVTPANHTPIGNSTTAFTGSYDGDNFNIRALSVSQSTEDYAGMFGYVDGGEIKDLSLSLLQVSGGDDYVGGLIGYATGATITNVEILGTSGTHITGKYNLGGMIGEANDCTITDADIMNSTVTSSGGDDSGSNIGGLIGLMSGTGSISDSESECTVSSDGGEDVGGLIGESQVNVSNCSSTATVNAVDYVGGLIGFADGGTISSCYSRAVVTGNDYVGGFIGDADDCTITGCSYDSNDDDSPVLGNDYVGGFIGRVVGECNISDSRAFGFVTGNSQTGGFIGRNEASDVANCYVYSNVSASGIEVGGFIGICEDSGGVFPNVTECYSKGLISYYIALTGLTIEQIIGFLGEDIVYHVKGTNSDNDDVGGFIGENWGLVENCYTEGIVKNSGGSTDWFASFVANNNEEDSEVQNCYIAADYTSETTFDFIVGNEGTASNNFYDSDLQSATIGTGATGKTTAEMKTATNYLDASWDFTSASNEWAMNQDENDGYPFLRFQENDQLAPLTPGHIWLGAAKSTSWDAIGNWSEGELPGTTSNVIIPDVANDVEIASGVGADCNKLTVETGASLTIKSGGSLITLGAITNEGTITTERQIDDSEWHLISIPCPGITANTFLGDYLQYWTEEGQTWTDIVEPTTELSVGQGYSLWGTPKGSYSFEGTPNTGNQSFSLSYHENLDPLKTADGMNLVGNPYPSSIDWAILDDTYGTAYLYNPTSGEYDELLNGTATDIAPMQGFFIYTTSNGSNFSLQNSHRSHGGSFYKNNSELANGVVLGASYGSFADELRILFENNAEDGFNLIDDSWKLFSTGEGVSQLWSYSPDGKLAIDKRPETETIQLGFANNQPGVYSIGIKEIADIPEVYLEDTKTQKFHNLMTKDYEFTWNPDFDSETRFILHFKAVGIEDYQISESDILVYAANGNIYVPGQADALTITDITGRVVLQQQLPNDDQITIPVNLHTGIYMVTLRHGDQIQTTKVFIE